MKKRLLAFLLAVCIACSMLVMPASASGSNTAVQVAVTLGGLTSEQTAALNAVLTRGQLAKMLVAFSSYRESAATQGTTGTLFTDVNGTSAYAPYIRIAVQQGWMSGYTDGSFRPDNPVTLEEGCTAALKLLGYDVTTLSGGFPTAQLSKASELGLRDGLTRVQGEVLVLEDGAVMLYNALTAANADGTAYGTTLGFTVTDGRVDTSSIQLGTLEGPFIADGTTALPFAPTSIYRNGTASASAELNAYDVYYYNAGARTVWIYTRKAAGRITAVSPSASAPTSVTVAGTEYTIASATVATQLSALNGGGVGQVVTLLLGMNDEVVGMLTGETAYEVYYGVVQTASRSLVEENGADVLQAVSVACTDGVTRTVNVDKTLNYPAGWLVQITVDENGENIQAIDAKSTSGTINAAATALGDTALASDVEILDTTTEGVAGTVSPSRLSGVTLSDSDVRYYTTNDAGQIDRIILNDVTGDLWTYVVLDDVKNITTAVTSSSGSGTATTTPSSSSSSSSAASTASTIVSDVADIVMPTTSEIVYGILDGSIGSTLWSNLTGSTGKLASYAMQKIADAVGGPVGNVLDWLAGGANYVCYENGKQVTYQTSVKYPVVVGGVAVGKNAAGTVTNMVQLMPTVVDKLGPASVMSGDTRYETADDMQVYLWYSGTYYATTLSQINTEDYSLIGWYDNAGRAAGNKIRVLVAVKNS